jgi:uncharacterized protein involved in exopolysaccharide biosynthesis
MDWSDETAPRGLDLPRLASAVYAHKLWIALPTAAAFVAAIGVVAFVKPRYTATAKVMLENGDSYFTRPEKASPDVGIIDDLTVQSEAEAAKSPEVERVALAKLKPEDAAEFSGGGLLSGGSAGAPEDRRLEAFAKHVEIYPQAKTRVLLFEFTSEDRARAARAANALAESFLESQQAAKDAEAKAASKWLSDQLDELRQRVATAEGRVEELRAKSGLLTGANGLAVPSQQLGEIASQIAAARAAESAANAKAASLRGLARAGRLDEIASVANDESLRRYADQRVTLKAQIAELSRTLLPSHPRMKELQGQLVGYEQEIRAAALKRARSFEEEARIADAQVKSLQQAVTAQAQTVSSSDADQVKLRELEIDAKTAREQFESYLTKYREAIARNAENAVPANGRIIARALSPIAPTFPKAGPLMLLAPLAGLFASLGLVVAKVLLTDGSVPAAAPAARREPKMPFGIDPPPPAAPEEIRDDRQAWTAQVERFADRLADTAEGDSLPLMVAGEGGALPAALTAARRLTRRGATALIDLGPSPDWLPDLFDRERDVEAGAAHRDLSTPLDIFPSPQGEMEPQDIAARLEALARDYAFVVVHAADWRSPAAARAIEDMAALLIVAPASEIDAVERRARAAYRDVGLAIKAVGTGAPAEAQERAA